MIEKKNNAYSFFSCYLVSNDSNNIVSDKICFFFESGQLLSFFSKQLSKTDIQGTGEKLCSLVKELKL